MASENFLRLIRLAEETFAMKSDPDQLQVNEHVRDRLLKMHPATLSEFSDTIGPVAWLLVIPTTRSLMEDFLAGRISEQELFDLTPLGTTYQTIYLCSALVLEEYRRQGIAKSLAMNAISDICRNHPVEALFTWPFTREGDIAAKQISLATGLPLYFRTKSGVDLTQ
jgi:ribosomal protein S18 acetylase RimI-like enzyme